MDFNPMAIRILNDERVKEIPITYINQVLICVNDILKECNENKISTFSNEKALP